MTTSTPAEYSETSIELASAADDRVSSEEMRRVLSYVGSIRTAKKSASSRENGKLGGRPVKALESLPCTCGLDAMDEEKGLSHKANCPRGRAIRRRQKREDQK